MKGTKKQVPNGILGFPVAPMDKAGVIDYESLKRNIEFLLEEGLQSIFIACGAGELQSINIEEYRKMVSVGIESTAGKVPLYTGVGGNLSAALEQAEISAELGADGYLILPPYLIEPSQDGISEYLGSIIKSTQLRAIVYQRDNCVLEIDTIENLCDHPQLVGFKDGVGNMEFNIELKHRLGDRLEYINGLPLAEMTMAAYSGIGFHSYSSAISNYIPHISSLYYKALLDGNSRLSDEIYRDVILPINKIRKMKKGYAVALIKAGMKIVGLPISLNVRAPIVPVEDVHYQALEKVILNALEKYPK
ncbi:5-dehydro-4-deoxyglucarate dehydratase [Salinicoccus sesuvii]|uniref:5-dehydro-4-deoxyglucarate dehydratase n=1 Tax=Salinicoccus sesuvii TaxID=868281 RepID=A0ABV7N4P0_9STAP